MNTTCYLCGKPLDGPIDRDHVIPIRASGPDHPSNIRPTHASCNRRKHAALPTPERNANYLLPLLSRSERNQSLWRYRDLKWRTERTATLRRGKLNNWITWPDVQRLSWFIVRRGIRIDRNRWKDEELNKTPKLIALLRSHGIAEITARQWIWSAQNNIGRIFNDRQAFS